MSRVCEISGKRVMSGNNVSHAKNKTRRKFIPNLQNVKLFSKILNKFINMKISVRALKTVEKSGGLDEGDEIVIGNYKAISRELKHNTLVKVQTDKDKKKK